MTRVLVPRAPRRRRWVEAVLCCVAMVGVGLALLPDFREVRSRDWVATDFKTLYGSATLFVQGGDPYDSGAIGEIYRREGVVEPATMFGRMPVYPPMTLLVLAPLLWLSMGAAAQVWLVLSLGLTGAVLWAVLRAAEESGVGSGWRLVMLAFSAGSPLLAFALNVGNVSVAASALALGSAVMALPGAKRSGEPYGRRDLLAGVMLSAALCLKPHLAGWIAIGIALCCGRRGRLIALTGAAGFLSAVLASVALLAGGGRLLLVLYSFAAVLRQEQAIGSMAPWSREPLAIGAQFTGLRWLLGLWLPTGIGEGISDGVLGLSGAVLAWVALRNRGEAKSSGQAVFFLAAVIAMGMIASYHRAHDGLILSPLLLWLCRDVWGMREASIWTRSLAATFLAMLLAGLWFAVPEALLREVHGRLRELIALRQSAMCWLLLEVFLLALVGRSVSERKKTARTFQSVPGGQ